jgi:hypothetical protein
MKKALEVDLKYYTTAGQSVAKVHVIWKPVFHLSSLASCIFQSEIGL